MPPKTPPVNPVLSLSWALQEPSQDVPNMEEGPRGQKGPPKAIITRNLRGNLHIEPFFKEKWQKRGSKSLAFYEGCGLLGLLKKQKHS